MRAFGAWPREHARSKGSAAQPAQVEKERVLAKRLREARAAGCLTHEEDGGYLTREVDAIVNEMYWTYAREKEAEAMDRAAAREQRRRETQRQKAKARKARLLQLLTKVKADPVRCTCHDFAYFSSIVA